jgi:hypothetical protein
MARRAHCPNCDQGDGVSGIVDLPHECPNAPYQPENYGGAAPPKANVDRDEEGRPTGGPFRPAKAPPAPPKPADKND